MKVIVAGGRHLKETPYIRSYVKAMLQQIGATEVVSGHYMDRDGNVQGGDAIGESVGDELKLIVTKFPAEWEKHPPKAAGPIRNLRMAQYANAAIILDGGLGTLNMFNEAKYAKIDIYVFPFTIPNSK